MENVTSEMAREIAVRYSSPIGDAVRSLADQLDEMTRKNAQSERVDHDPPGWAVRHHAVSIDALRGKTTALGNALAASTARCEALERELREARSAVAGGLQAYESLDREATLLRERLAASVRCVELLRGFARHTTGCQFAEQTYEDKVFDGAKPCTCGLREALNPATTTNSPKKGE